MPTGERVRAMYAAQTVLLNLPHSSDTVTPNRLIPYITELGPDNVRPFLGLLLAVSPGMMIDSVHRKPVDLRTVGGYEVRIAGESADRPGTPLVILFSGPDTEALKVSAHAHGDVPYGTNVAIRTRVLRRSVCETLRFDRLGRLDGHERRLGDEDTESLPKTLLFDRGIDRRDATFFHAHLATDRPHLFSVLLLGTQYESSLESDHAGNPTTAFNVYGFTKIDRVLYSAQNRTLGVIGL